MKYLLLILSLVCFSLSAQKVIIVDTNTGKEYEKNFPSRTNVIPDLENNLKVYYVLQKQRPSYDYLTEKLVPIRRFTDSIAEGNNYPYVIKEWQKVRLTDTEIRRKKEIAIIQKDLNLMVNNVPDDEFKQIMLMGLAAVMYQMDGATLTAEQEEIRTIIKTRGIKVFQNRKRKTQLIENLQIDPTIDITKGWSE